MRRLFFIPILFLFIIFGCSNDDDNSNNPFSFEINGVWNLINVQGGFAGVDQDFEKGTIIWTFNESTKMVTIANNTTITGVYSGLASGTYPYSINALANTSALELIVNENSLGTLALVTPLIFTVDDQPLDGFKITFER
ncbi:hypothetical protein [Aquimarina sp. MMG016]|uniref:hypothetical protein n=1 Tax=Aquimarina sp. MMG016 TaxID=2822690 RepID=UPI001B39DD4A|nr:hypothetical protein [Aquimarina sp. MMG016]MBQ4819245.1 hypothetical protein [Aquimarina sp. MMG016]